MCTNERSTKVQVSEAGSRSEVAFFTMTLARAAPPPKTKKRVVPNSGIFDLQSLTAAAHRRPKATRDCSPRPARRSPGPSSGMSTRP